MVKSGDDVLILDEDHGLSGVPGKESDDALLYTEGLARGQSIVSQGDDVMLVADQFAQGRAEGSGVIYYSEFRGDGSNERIYKLDKETFEVLEQYDVNWVPHGIGGDADVVWVGDENDRTLVFKRNPDTLSKIDEGTLPVDQTEMGGGAGVLYVALVETGEIARLDPDSFAVQQRVNTPGGTNGIGGKTNVCWNCTESTVYELDPDDLSTVIRSNDVSGSLGQNDGGGSLVGIGGSATSIFACENGSLSPGGGRIHSIDPDTLEITDSTDIDFGTGEPSGIGGY